MQCLTGLISCHIFTTNTPACLPSRVMYGLSFSLKSVPWSTFANPVVYAASCCNRSRYHGTGLHLKVLPWCYEGFVISPPSINIYFTHHYTKESMAKTHLHCKVFIHLIQTCTFAIQPIGSLHFMAKAHIVPPRLWRADQWLVSLFKQGHGLLRISHVKIHAS